MLQLKPRLIATLAVAALGLGGCASGPDIRGDYDKSADFGKYRTYGFVAQTSPDGGGEYRSLALQMLQKAAAREMEARGYRLADSPDLAINFQGKLEEKVDVESTPAPYYG
ncbi:MAG: putative lipoprotein, partial [Proteobacteria bacterium]|nr:putative lipoprotein [Pseudomonadota bacterium]